MHIRHALVLFALIAPLSHFSLAQTSDSESAKPTENEPAKLANFEEPQEKEADPTAKREDVSEKLRVAKEVLDSAEKATPSGKAAPEPLAEEVKLLKQLEATHAQQQATEQRTPELKTAKADLDGKLKVLRASGPSEERPFSFALLEQLRDELALETGRTELLSGSVNQRQQSLERAKTQHDEKESARRKAKEAVDANNDKSKLGKLTAAQELAELESKLARETAQLQKMQRDNEQLILETHKLHKTYLSEKIAAVAAEVVVTDEDKQTQLDAINDEEIDLEWLRDEAQTQFSIVEQRWADTREQLDKAADKSPALVAEVKSHHLAQQVEQQTLEVVNQRLSRVGDNRTAWTRRFKLQEHAYLGEDMIKWRDETKVILDRLDRELKTQTVRLADWRRETTALEKKHADTPATDNEVATWQSEQQSHSQKLIKVYEQNQESIETSQQLYAKLLADIKASGEGGSAGIDLAFVWDRAAKLWNYELLAVDDRPITPRKIVTGLFLLVLGVLMSRWVTKFVGCRILSRLHIHPNAAAAMQSLSFYVLIFLVALFSLHIANVPLTAFTILGGALALGIGFGSQNIINNFISGLIILAERPVRVGDLIEIDHVFATVDRIGARSTRLRTGANLEIIVPNSRFLEQNVTNWTLSDTKVRSIVCIGVAYGSPTDLVTEILVNVAADHKNTLSNPKPYVLFTDFADNSLNFEVRFWIAASQLDERLSTESDLRYAINEAFAEANISIAYPQRDVHLDTNGPICVQMVEPIAVPQVKAA